ncbi:MAG TPA: DotU family type IV/VI secretion system protein [Bryobacteraceae bacterium]|jgi:type VI secretion system protein ImpK|nr:DotU family type IV/VI secretion system protein [Bryobacteraceae bacterium]
MTPTQPTRRVENLAFVFQELLTVGERLRSNRQQVADAASFRAQIWGAVRQAEEDARRRVYPTDDIELAVFAVVAFLDESILNLRLPVFADWPRQPLQEERYGHHVAGEIFFQNLQKLMTRTDSYELADLLEMYQLALLLGFAGKYSMGGRGELRGITMQTGERIQRIRQTSSWLAPGWQLPAEAPVKTGGDPWVSRMAVILIACVVLVAVLFGIFVVLLNQGSNDISRMAGA